MCDTCKRKVNQHFEIARHYIWDDLPSCKKKKWTIEKWRKNKNKELI